MIPPYLELHFEPDSDGTGELFACVHRNDYSGAGSAWFHLHEIETFGQLLASTYPIQHNTEISLRGGYWKSGAGPPELQDVLLSLRVYPINSTGTIAILVEVMDGTFEGQRQENRARLSLELLTNYESIRAFGESMAQLTHLRGATAWLNANAA